MKKEELVELGLNDEQIAGVFKINGKDIEKFKEDLKVKETELETAKEHLQTANEQIEELGKVDVEKIQEKVNEYKDLYEKTKTEKETELQKIKFEHQLEKELTKSGVRNAKAVKALLNDEGLAYSEGKIAGLQEQLEAIKESDNYLFKQEERQGSEDKPFFLRPGVGDKQKGDAPKGGMLEIIQGEQAKRR